MRSVRVTERRERVMGIPKALAALVLAAVTGFVVLSCSLTTPMAEPVKYCSEDGSQSGGRPTFEADGWVCWYEIEESGK